jgi:flagellar export protein FliJ
LKALAVLQRLAKLAVDHERQALLAIGGEIADLEGEIDRWRQAIARESADFPDVMTSGATLAAYVAASKARMRELETRCQALRQAYDIQRERVRAQRIEEKRYQRLAERRAEQAAREAAAKEQKTIDELVTITGKKVV